MKKILLLLLPFFANCHAQVLKIVENGLILVTDSSSDKKIVENTFDHYQYNSHGKSLMRDYSKEKIGGYIVPELINDSMLVLQQNGFWGCINLHGKEIVPFLYYNYLDFYKNARYFGNYFKVDSERLPFTKEVVYAIVDYDINVVVKYYGLVMKWNNLYLMQGEPGEDGTIAKKCGIISNNLDTILPFDYSCTSWDDKNFFFSQNGFLALKNGQGKCGVINTIGKTIIPFEYDFIEDVVFDLNLVENNNKKGLLDKNMHFALPVEYDDIKNSSDFEGPIAALALKNGIWEVWDTSYHIYCANKFEYIGELSFSNTGKTMVKERSKFGIYDFSTRKYVIEPICDTIIPYQTTMDSYDNSSTCFVLKKNKIISILDSSLNKKAEFHGDQMCPIDGTHYLILTKSQKKYLVTDDGNTVSKAYDDIIYNHSGYNALFHGVFFVKLNNKYGWINKEGKPFIPVEYDAGCPFYMEYKYDGNHIYSFSLLKGNTIYYFDKNGNSTGTSNWNKYGSFCDQ